LPEDRHTLAKARGVKAKSKGRERKGREGEEKGKYTPADMHRAFSASFMALSQA